MTTLIDVCNFDAPDAAFTAAPRSQSHPAKAHQSTESDGVE